MKNNSSSQREDIAIKVSKNTIIVNLLLSIFKITAGVLASSSAIISDGVHSASDVLSTFGVIIGIRMSSKKADKNHPYGHERLESVAAIILSFILTITALGIAQAGFKKIFLNDYGSLAIPGILALVAAIVSIITQEILYRYAKSNADKINSAALLADAWHHRSDALSSIGSFIGVLGARLGFPILDPVASIVISIFILKAAVDIFRDSIDQMVDKSCDKDFENEIRDLVLQQKGVIKIRDMKTRIFGSVVYVDIIIIANANKTLKEGQVIADLIHNKIEEEFQLVKHIDVHVHPN